MKTNTIYENYTLLAEDDGASFVPSSYHNKGGNCLVCAICDIINYFANDILLKPAPRTRKNNKEYGKICETIYHFAIKEETKSLRQLTQDKYTGVIAIAYQGGYHAIAMIKGLILNNWEIRDYQTINDFIDEIGYQKAPKVVYNLSAINMDNIKMDLTDMIFAFNGD